MTRGLRLIAILLLPVAATAAPLIGDRVPKFSLPTPSGASYSWKPGGATVISFCAFWCDTWKEQSKRLGSASGALHGLPVEFITISVDGRWSELAARKIEGTVLVDRGRKLAKSLGIERIPYTLVLDARGHVRYACQGIVRSDAVENAVRECLAAEEPTRSGVIYLTFDDFPSGPRDDELLDTLRAHEVPATFFCIGYRIAAAHAIVRRAAREGHSLHMHSWDHNKTNPRLERCSQALRVIGVTPTLYRPPGGSSILRIGGGELPMSVVNPYDYTRPGRGELLRRVLSAAKPDSVILLHAGVGETIDALPAIIRSLKSRGFVFALLH